MKKVLDKLNLQHKVVQLLIQVLTKNEDLQQDLWVSYLSGDIKTTFCDKLEQLTLRYDVEQRCVEKLQEIINLDIVDSLNTLSDLQCSILFMTMLGYTLEQVSKYNGVEQVIIDQELVNLTKHPLWVEYGIKKEPKSRRKIRTNRRRDQDI
jgi:hypothetical protein